MKIALITNRDLGVWQLRRELIQTLIYNGHHVTVITPEGPFIEQIKSLGATVELIDMQRYVSIKTDIASVFQIYHILKKDKYDIVYTMTVKPNIYGMIAAKLAGIPKRFGLVCGLGYGFVQPQNMKQRLFQYILHKMYRLGGLCTNQYVFQNFDDRDLMIEKNIISKDKTVVIKSSGIDLELYSPNNVNKNQVIRIRNNEFGVNDDTIVVGVITRMTVTKGIRDFIQASRIATEWNIKVMFIAVGECELDDSDYLQRNELKETSNFKWLGFRTDIKELLQCIDIVTLPSFYREGIPRILLEGMAMHKPIVTTDNVGCRETVDNGVNGFIVPIKEPNKLADAIKKLVLDKNLREQFGENSFLKVKKEFEIKSVIKRLTEDVLGIKNIQFPDSFVSMLKLVDDDVNTNNSDIRQSHREGSREAA
ncbi:MAG: glycosyltransferase family 4 protein [Planctomycetaceae bacterium]|jgi:N,N'-diacetylbacillosaminyl-diphospho-undecaprenol alpha-1,3-N-acetylgalactosaminyltransferase|nr:glycosyltransferase family 4 protein [Planctomycetaceae bacterium]